MATTDEPVNDPAEDGTTLSHQQQQRPPFRSSATVPEEDGIVMEKEETTMPQLSPSTDCRNEKNSGEQVNRDGAAAAGKNTPPKQQQQSPSKQPPLSEQPPPPVVIPPSVPCSWKETLGRHCWGRSEEQEQIAAFLHTQPSENEEKDGDHEAGSSTTATTTRSEPQSTRNEPQHSPLRYDDDDEENNNAYSPLLVLTGPAGVGKTRLVRHCLYNMATKEEQVMKQATFLPLVIQGQFEYGSPLTPYGGWSAALDDLARQWMSLDSSVRFRLQQTLLREWSNPNDVALLTTAFSSLASLFVPSEREAAIIQKTRANTVTTTHHRPKYDERLGTLVQRFLCAVVKVLQDSSHCQRDQEVVLIICLDNAHLAHDPSLELLALLVSELPVPGCQWILCGTTTTTTTLERTGAECEALRQKLKAMEAMWNTQIEQMQLEPLSEEGVREVIQGAVLPNCNAEESNRLVKIGYDVTQGNCLHLFWFLQWLEDEEYLVRNGTTGEWSCGVDAVSLSMENTVRNPVATSDSLSSLLSLQVLVPAQANRRGGVVSDLLQIASCLQPSFSAQLLERVVSSLAREKAALDVTPNQLSAFLEQAVAQGFLMILRSSSKDGPTFSFASQAVATNLQWQISCETRAHIHLMAGRNIWETADSSEMEKVMYLILNHLYTSLSICREMNPSHDFSEALQTRGTKERWAIATLCFHAGQVAAKLSAFTEASNAFDFGVQSLTPEDWRENYDLSLALHSHAAEAHVGSGLIHDVDDIVKPVIQHARVTTDKVTACCALIQAQGSAGRQEDAIFLGLSLLEELGCVVPYPVPKGQLLYRMLRLLRRLSRMSDGQILRLPRMTDNREKIGILQVLHVITINFLGSSLSQPAMMAFVSILSVETTLDFGLTVFAASAFSMLGMGITRLGKFDDAARFARIAKTLLEQFGAIAFLPRVHMTNYGIIQPWTRPVRECLDPLFYAYRIGRQTGDLQFAVLCGVKCCASSIEAGIPLVQVLRYWKSLYHVMLTQNDTLSLAITLPHMQRVHNYLGLTDDPLAEKGDLIDYGEAKATASGFAILMLKYARMHLCYVFNDYSRGNENIIEPKELKEAPRSIELMSMLYLRAALLIEMVRMNVKRRIHLREVRRIIAKFDQLSKGSPHNLTDRYYLLMAEMSSLNGNDDEAYRNFVVAISVTKKERNLLMHALAQERCALHFLRKASSGQNLIGHESDRELALPHLLAALESYKDWGGVAKVLRLRQSIVQLFGEEVLAQ